MKPLLIVDRDGVLNRLIYDTANGRAPRTLDEIEFLASRSHLDYLHEIFSVSCITNQPDIANKKSNLVDVYSIHDKIMAHYGITHSYMCTHNNFDDCDCRKPATLMLELVQFISGENIEATIIGDRWTDVLAGNKLGWKTILIESDDFAMTPTSHGSPPENLSIDKKVRNWPEAFAYLTNRGS